MFAYALDMRKFDGSVIPYRVDCSIRLAESHRTITLPLTLQWFIVIPREPASGFKPGCLDAPNPRREVAHDVRRTLPQVLPGARLELAPSAAAVNHSG
jgi:hypothetical protein